MPERDVAPSSPLAEDIVLVDTHHDEDDEHAPLLGNDNEGAQKNVGEEEGDEEEESGESGAATAERDTRFDRPTPSPWKRLALVLFIIFLFWLASSIRARRSKKPEVVYASRYSKEHKYRPAASPIITETLKDGRIRLRGATPPPPTPTPTPTPKTRKRKSKAGKATGKKRAQMGKSKTKKGASS